MSNRARGLWIEPLTGDSITFNVRSFFKTGVTDRDKINAFDPETECLQER